jgi:hypothetical protein
MTASGGTFGETDRRGALGLAAIATAAGASGLSACAPDKTSPIRGYGKDPDLLTPGKHWPLTLTARERDSLTQLADMILPADGRMPAPSALGFATFIDEWMSAPYPQQQKEAALFRKLLAALDAHAGPGGFRSASRASQETAVRALEPGGPQSIALDAFRSLVVAAAYTTPIGMEVIGYRGNIALDRFDGPPADVLDHFEAALGRLTEL